MVGPDARVDCEPGQVRKEAAISMFSPVPSVARPWARRIAPASLFGGESKLPQVVGDFYLVKFSSAMARIRFRKHSGQ